MPAFKFIIFILVLIVIALFAAKNMNSVEIQFYDYTFNTQTIKLPVMVVVLVPFGLGFLISWLIEFFHRLKLKSQIRRQTRTIQSLEEELDHLRAKPPAGEPVGKLPQ